MKGQIWVYNGAIICLTILYVGYFLFNLKRTDLLWMKFYTWLGKVQNDLRQIQTVCPPNQRLAVIFAVGGVAKTKDVIF